MHYQPRSGQSKKMDFTEKIIISMLSLFILFIIWVMIIFSRTGLEPSTTVASVTGFVVGEFSLAAWLRKNKREIQHKENIFEMEDKM
jgi:archaellum biogenesis protein FlaJ (TadC family)